MVVVVLVKYLFFIILMSNVNIDMEFGVVFFYGIVLIKLILVFCRDLFRGEGRWW